MLGYTQPNNSRPHITTTSQNPQTPSDTSSDVVTETQQSQGTEKPGVMQRIWNTVERYDSQISVMASVLFLGNTAFTAYNTVKN